MTNHSQNRKKADSIYTVLKKGDFSKQEKSKLLTTLAYYHPKLDSALLFAKESYYLAVEIDNFLLKGQALEEISHLERSLGNHGKSLKASLDALKIFEKHGFNVRVAASYNQLAVNHMMDDNYPQSIEYLKKAIDIYSNDSTITNQTLTRLNLGEAYRLKGDLDSAAINFRKTLSLNISLKDSIIQSYSLGNLGMVHNTQDSLNLAETELTQAITILKELGDPYSTSVYLAELGQVYNKQGLQKEAEQNLLEAMDISKVAGLKEQIRDFSAVLTSFYEEKEQFKKALGYQKQFQIYQDSLVNKENVQQIEQLKAGYEINKRESQIGLLNKINSNQRYLLFTLGGGILLVLVFIYLLAKANRRIKKANQTLSLQKEVIVKREQEKAWLLRELNHRVKNNLQMISSLLSLQSRELKGHPAKEALLAGQQRVEALSLVHQKLYQEGVDTKIAAKTYITDLVLGLFHGYNAQFKPSFTIDAISINIDTAIPLALIINELVINALKYAYTDIPNPTFQVIMTKAADNELQLDIIDNGIGFLATDKKQSSFGIKLIYSLIQQLEGSIEKIEGQGTHWKIRLKEA